MQHDLKLAPYLRPAALQPSHYDKMKVGLATAIFSQEVAAALEYLVKAEKMEENALTTAWFLKTVHRWFRLISSRSRKTALSYFNRQKHEEATEFLTACLSMFSTMQIGNAWKPVQRGLLLTTSTALELGKNPVPTSKESKSALRMISAAQYFKPNRNGNYEAEDADFLLEYLKTRQSSSTTTDTEHSSMFLNVPEFTYGSSLCEENVIPNQFFESKMDFLQLALQECP